MNKDLKKAIIEWLFKHENQWQRVNACHEEFRNYIYNKDGEYLIGGKDVSEFIRKADNFIYSALE